MKRIFLTSFDFVFCAISISRNYAFWFNFLTTRHCGGRGWLDRGRTSCSSQVRGMV